MSDTVATFEPVPVPSEDGTWPDDVVDQLNRHLGELGDTMGIKVLDVSRQRMRATMPVIGNRQPMGLLHGGASAVMAESIGSMLAALLAPTGKVPVGIELSCAHHRSATGGNVIADCVPVSVGRTLATMTISVADDSGRPVCTARLTCLYRDPPAPATQ